jgi:Flp pilus assembly protein TadG
MMRIGTRRRERGAELIEAAVVMPLLLIMLAIVLDLGRAYFCYIAVIDAAREGARYGVANQNSTAICAWALAEAQNQPLPVTFTCVADPGQGSGTPVIVTVSCDFPLIMGGLVGRPSILISHTAAFRIR